MKNSILHQETHSLRQYDSGAVGVTSPTAHPHLITDLCCSSAACHILFLNNYHHGLFFWCCRITSGFGFCFRRSSWFSGHLSQEKGDLEKSTGLEEKTGLEQKTEMEAVALLVMGQFRQIFGLHDNVVAQVNSSLLPPKAKTALERLAPMFVVVSPITEVKKRSHGWTSSSSGPELAASWSTGRFHEPSEERTESAMGLGRSLDRMRVAIHQRQTNPSLRNKEARPPCSTHFFKTKAKAF